jgi:CarD family transcriptional regulator
MPAPAATLTEAVKLNVKTADKIQSAPSQGIPPQGTPPHGTPHGAPHGTSHGNPPGAPPRPSGPPHNGRPAPVSRASNKDESFAEGDYVVYPTHGVGKVEKIAVEDIAGHRLELIHITFEENRMTLRVPVAKARSAGLRRLATRKMFDEALAVLKGRARVKRTMWSRRAQEYEAKINSGDPIAIAEVVRDLHRNAGQPDQSFSERQIYEAAMDRLAAELAALDQIDKAAASVKLAEFLKTI